MNIAEALTYSCSVQQIRETPQKIHQKYIEFYDTRAAEAALRELNSRYIAGKQIKLEPSHLRGLRKWYCSNLSTLILTLIDSFLITIKKKRTNENTLMKKYIFNNN